MMKLSAVLEQIWYSTDNMVEAITQYPKLLVNNLSYVWNILVYWFKQSFYLPDMDISVFKNLFALVLIIAIISILIWYIYSAIKDYVWNRTTNTLSNLANLIIRWFSKYFIIWFVVFLLVFSSHYLIKLFLNSSDYGKGSNNSDITVISDKIMYNTYFVSPRSYGLKTIPDYLIKDCVSNIPQERVVFNNPKNLQCGFYAPKTVFPQLVEEQKYPQSLADYSQFAGFLTNSTSGFIQLENEWRSIKKPEKVEKVGEIVNFWKITTDINSPSKWLTDKIHLLWWKDEKTYYLLKGIFDNIQYINDTTKIKDYNVKEFFNNPNSKITLTLNGKLYGFMGDENSKTLWTASKTIQIPITLKVRTNSKDWGLEKRLSYSIFEGEEKDFWSVFNYWDDLTRDVKFFEVDSWNLVLKNFDVLINAWLIHEYKDKFFPKEPNTANPWYMPSLFLDAYFFWWNYFLAYDYTLNIYSGDHFKKENIRTTKNYKYTPWFITELLYQGKKGRNLLKENKIPDVVNEDVLRGEVASLLPFLTQSRTLTANRLFVFSDEIISLFTKSLWQGSYYSVDYIPLDSKVENAFVVNNFKASDFDYIWEWTKGEVSQGYKWVFDRTWFIQSIFFDLRKVNDSIFANPESNAGFSSENSYNKSFYYGQQVWIFEPLRSNTTLWIVAGIATLGLAIISLLIPLLRVLWRALFGGDDTATNVKKGVLSGNMWNYVVFLFCLFLWFWTVYEWLYALVFLLIFIGILVLNRRRSVGFLDKVNDDLTKKQKAIETEMQSSKRWVYTWLKYAFLWKMTRWIGKLSAGIDKMMSSSENAITNDGESKTDQSGQHFWTWLIQKGLALLFSFVFLALSYRIGVLVVSWFNTWTSLDYSYYGGILMLSMIMVYTFSDKIQSFLVDLLLNVVLSQLVSNESFFNRILSQYANLSQVEKMTTNVLNVDKVVAKKFDKDNKDGIEGLSKKQVDNLTKDTSHLTQGFNKVDSLIDDIKEQTIGKVIGASETVYDQARKQLFSFQAKTDLHWLSGALANELWVSAKKTFLTNLWAWIKWEELKSIERGTAFQNLISLNDLKKSWKFKDTFNAVFDMLKAGEKNIFSFNAMSALKNIPSYIKSNKERLVDELQKYQIDLNDDTKWALFLKMNTYSKWGVKFLDKFLNEIEHPYRKKYGVEKMASINNALNAFLESGGTDFASFTSKLNAVGIEPNDIKELTQKAHNFNIDYKNIDKDFNYKVLKNFEFDLEKRNKAIVKDLKDQAFAQNNKTALSLIDYIEKNDATAWYLKFKELEENKQFREADIPLLSKVEDMLFFMSSLEWVVDYVRQGKEGVELEDRLKTLKQAAITLWDTEVNASITWLSERFKRFAKFSSGVDQYALKFAWITEGNNILKVLSSPIYKQHEDDINDIIDAFFEGKISIKEAGEKISKIPIFDRYSPLYQSLNFNEKNKVDNDYLNIEKSLQSFERARQEVLNSDAGLNTIIWHFLTTNLADNNLSLELENNKEKLENVIKQVLDPNSDKSKIDIEKQVGVIRQSYLKKLWYEDVYGLDTIAMIDYDNPNTDYQGIASILSEKFIKNKDKIGKENVEKILFALKNIKGDIDEEWNPISESDRAVRRKNFENIQAILNETFLWREEWGVKVWNMLWQLDEYFNYLKGITVSDQEEALKISRKKSSSLIKANVFKVSNQGFEHIKDSIKKQDESQLSELAKSNLYVKTSQINSAFNAQLEWSLNKILESNNVEELNNSFTGNDIVNMYSTLHWYIDQAQMWGIVSKSYINKNIGQVIKSVATRRINERFAYAKDERKTITGINNIIKSEVDILKKAFHNPEMKRILWDDYEALTSEILTEISAEIVQENVNTFMTEIEESNIHEQEKIKKALNTDYYGDDIKWYVKEALEKQKEAYDNDVMQEYSKMLDDNFNHMNQEKVEKNEMYWNQITEFKNIIKNAVDLKVIDEDKHLGAKDVIGLINKTYQVEQQKLDDEIKEIEKYAREENRKLSPEEAQNKFLIMQKKRNLLSQQNENMAAFRRLNSLNGGEPLYFNSAEWWSYLDSAKKLNEIEAKEKNIMYENKERYDLFLKVQKAINEGKTISDVLSIDTDQDYNWWLVDELEKFVQVYQDIEEEYKNLSKESWINTERQRKNNIDKQKFFNSFGKITKKLRDIGAETEVVDALMWNVIKETITNSTQWKQKDLENNSDFQKMSIYDKMKYLWLENYELSEKDLNDNNLEEIKKSFNKDTVKYKDIIAKNSEYLSAINKNIQSKTGVVYDKSAWEKEIIRRSRKMAREILSNNIYEGTLDALQGLSSEDFQIDFSTKTYGDIAEKIVGSWNKMAVSKMIDVLEGANIFEELEKKGLIKEDSLALKKEIASLIINDTKNKIDKRNENLSKMRLQTISEQPVEEKTVRQEKLQEDIRREVILNENSNMDERIKEKIIEDTKGVALVSEMDNLERFDTSNNSNIDKKIENMSWPQKTTKKDKWFSE